MQDIAFNSGFNAVTNFIFGEFNEAFKVVGPTVVVFFRTDCVRKICNIFLLTDGFKIQELVNIFEHDF